MTSDLRDHFLSCLQRREAHATRNAALAYLAESTDGGRWRMVRRQMESLPEGELGLIPLRVALLASFSIEFILDPLLALGMANGLRILPYRAGFAQYHQELIDPSSGLYAFRPDVVILAIEGERLLPALYAESLSLEGSDMSTLVEQALGAVEPLIVALRKQSNALLLLNNLEPPRHPLLGILDGHLPPFGEREATHAVNSALLELVRRFRGCHVVDYAGVVARFGAENWHDPRMAHMAKAPIAQRMLPHLAAEYLKFLRARAGLSRKCLVVDLDNTLWGGILGEDGPHGIRLGADYPGSAFVALQRTLLRLHARGVLLAIASKNNPEDVEEVFRAHPAMVVRKEHFAAMEIHWQPKSESLLSIARRLNIGLEHMVFLDDSPMECAQVQAALPMVTVIPFPAQPEEAVNRLLHDGWFDTLQLSAEDRKRGDLYWQKAQIDALQAASGSLEGFYASLRMRLTIAPLTPATLTRAAQLTQKTNQFNLTTLRFSEEEVAKRMKDPAWSLFTVRVEDRFGDNGIVGVMMATKARAEPLLEVETFLLSCRVIGRTVETAMLATLCRKARELGLAGVLGRVIPTPKNLPARPMYERHGFALRSDTLGESVWVLEFAAGEVGMPPWFTLTGEEHGRANQAADGGYPGSGTASNR
ncbi:MAG: HAD family hydrolase [Magnetococcales bacterium]|nr:HAD family hydrolase [Magnetococcales bacterium]